MRRLHSVIVLKGKGLHSGRECVLRIEPYHTQTVILSNVEDESPISELRTDGTRRGSDYIFPSGERIRTCEHVFSALCGMGIYSGIRITVEGGEMPSLDGSAKKLCEEIERHSEITSEIPEHRDISEPLMVTSEGGKRFACIFPSDDFRITYTVEYPYVGVQTMDYAMSEMSYAEEIAPARTFAMRSEVEYLRSQGMALGGTLKNAILLGEVIEADGGLRWPNEFVRHKVLDLIGDIYGVGFPVKAHIIAMRAGHDIHLKLAEKVKGVIC